MQLNQSTAGQRTQSVALTNAFLRGVYAWMALGLGVTAVVSFMVLSSPQIMVSLGMTGFIVLSIVEVGLVFYLSSRLANLSAVAATGIFLVYSALNGVTLSFLLAVFTHASIMQAFVTTAGMFGAISIYGLVTKRDLSSVGDFCMMGLFGIIIALVVNMFLGSPVLDLGISIIGVIIFVGLTAYDTQMLKEMGNSVPANDALAIRRATIFGALRLYLDFINLFIMLLRIFGDRR